MEFIVLDMENYKVQNDHGSMLPQEMAERYLDVTIASAFSQDEVDESLLLTGLGHLAELANVELWGSRLSEKLINRLYLLISTTQTKDVVTTQASLLVLTLLSEYLSSNAVPSQANLAYLCTVFQSDVTLLEQFAVLLKKYENNTIVCQKIIRYLALHIQCILKWGSLDTKAAYPFAIKTNMNFKSSGLISVLSKMLYSKRLSIQHMMPLMNSFLIQLKSLKSFLRGLRCEDYESKVASSVKENTHKLFDVYDITRERFIKSNADYQNMSGLSILQVINLKYILLQSNLTAKKAFTEQLMFQEYPLPLFKTVTELSNMLWEYLEMSKLAVETQIYRVQLIFHAEEILVTLLANMVTMWEKSKSETPSDFESLLELVKILIIESDKKCQEQQDSHFRAFIEVCESSNYDKLRQLQVTQWRDKKYNNWSKDISSFDDILENQVQEFVRYQRLLLMQKGTWVYSENPTEAKDKLPKVSFIALSDNQMNLLIREFKHKVEKTPTVEDNDIVTLDQSATLNSKTLVIPLKNIANIQSKQIEVDKKLPEGARLINILQNTVYTEVIIHDRNAKILASFFLESTES